MSNSVNVQKEALTREVRELGLLQRSYSQTKGALKSCAKIVVSLTEAVILGGYTPLKAVVVKSVGIAARLFGRQANATHHTRYGVVNSSFGEMRSITTAGPAVNEEAIEEFSSAGRALQLPKAVGINPSSNAQIATYEGISFLPEQSVECSPLIFHPKELVKKSTQFMVDPRERRATHALVSKRSYLRFIATQTVATIKGNTYLIMRVAQLGTLYISKTLVDSMAKNQGMDPASWSYAIVTGLGAKVASDTVCALAHRYLTFRADRRAVEVTKDLESAVECMKVLDAFPQEKGSLEKIVFPLSLLCNEEDKIHFAMPSYKSRTEALDPRREFSAWELPALETFEPALSEEDEIARLEVTRAFFRRDLQFALDLRANGKFLVNISPHMARHLAKMLGAAYLGRYVGVNAAAGASLLVILLKFYPDLFSQLGRPAPFGVQQMQVTRIAKRMGIKKPVHVHTPPRGSLQVCAAPYVTYGVGSGPGRAIITAPSHEAFKEVEEFIFSHEVAHLKKNDNFTDAFVSIGALVGCNLLLDSLGFNPATHLETLVQGVLVSSTARGVKSAVSRRFEARADMLAISSAPAEERALLIKQGIDWLKDMRLKHIALRSQTNIPKLLQLFNKITISPEGDYRLDRDHPSFSARIHALEELGKKSA